VCPGFRLTVVLDPAREIAVVNRPADAMLDPPGLRFVVAKPSLRIDAFDDAVGGGRAEPGEGPAPRAFG
jgi:hypothetical protein